MVPGIRVEDDDLGTSVKLMSRGSAMRDVFDSPRSKRRI
jgi:hypothetical protein